MKKILLSIILLLGILTSAFAQEEVILDSYPRYIHKTTDRFYAPVDGNQVVYLADSTNWYVITTRYTKRFSMSDVFSDGNYYEVDSTYKAMLTGSGNGSSSTASGSAVGAHVNFVAGVQDGTVTWTSDSSLTIAGLPFTVGGSNWFVYIMGVANDTTVFIQNSPDDQNMIYSGGVLTIQNYTDALPSTAEYSVGMTVPEYTNPEFWVDDEDEDSGSVNMTAIDIMGAGYKYFSMDMYLYAGTNDTLTLKIYGTNNTTATTSSLSGWKDLTTLLLGSSSLQVINTTDTIVGIRSTPFPVDRIAIRRVYGASASGAEDNACEIYGVRSN